MSVPPFEAALTHGAVSSMPVVLIQLAKAQQGFESARTQLLR